MPIPSEERLEVLRMLVDAQQLAIQGRMLSMVLLVATVTDDEGTTRISMVQNMRSRMLGPMAEALRQGAQTLEDPELMKKAAQAYRADLTVEEPVKGATVLKLVRPSEPEPAA